jgi:hypothetical protein
MKINPKIAKTPEDLQDLSFKDVRAYIKKDLKRLEKKTSVEKPVPVMLWGEFAYTDKPTGLGLLVAGKWQGSFKQYAKKELATKEPLGAIGQMYFGGIDEDGQKVLQIDLAKGKGKAKTEKLAKGLRKLIPQATFNVVFGEMSEDQLENLDSQLDSQPDEEELDTELDGEDSGEALLADEGQIELAPNQDSQKLLNSNLIEISNTLGLVKVQVVPRLKLPAEDDLSTVEDLVDLCEEWQEIYREAGSEIQQKNLEALGKVKDIHNKALEIQQALQISWARNNPTQQENPSPQLKTAPTQPQPETLNTPPSKSPTQRVDEEGEALVKNGLFKPGFGGPAGYWARVGPIDPATGKRKPVKVAGPGQPIPKVFNGVEVPNPNPTWCNYFVWEMSKKIFGKEGDPFQGQEFGANAMNDYMIKNPDRFEALPMPANQDLSFIWRDYINKGKFVIFGWINPKGSGHVALGTTTAEQEFTNKDGWKYGNIIQAGASIGKMTLAAGFAVKRFPGLKFFVYKDANSYNQENPNPTPNPNPEPRPNPQPIGTNISTNLARKSKGEDVRTLQNYLAKAGYDLGSAGIDGDFGGKTEAAVLAIQQKYQLPQTGTVEPNSPTWLAIIGQLPLPNPKPNPTPNNNTNLADWQQRLKQGETLGITDPNMMRNMYVSSLNAQGKSEGICDIASRAMVYKYLDLAGVADTHLNFNKDITDDIDRNSPYYIGKVWDGKGTGNLAIIDHEETTANGLKYVPNLKTCEKAIKYIDYHLSQVPSVPVVVGVSYKDANYNVDKTTDHFIVVVAMKEQGGKKVYQYLEPGTTQVENKGINVAANQLVQNPEVPYEFWDSKIGIGRANDKYIITNVVLFQKDRGNDNWEKDFDEKNQTQPSIKPEEVQFQLKGTASKLNAKAEQVLREIFAQAGEANPVVISTYRTEAEQAGILYQNLVQYGPKVNRKAYRSAAAANQIVDAYEAAVAANQDAATITGVLLQTLQKIGAANISAHCDASNPAIDILPQSIKNKALFEQIAKSDARIKIICPPKDSSYHLEVKA